MVNESALQAWHKRNLRLFPGLQTRVAQIPDETPWQIALHDLVDRLAVRMYQSAPTGLRLLNLQIAVEGLAARLVIAEAACNAGVQFERWDETETWYRETR
jgi:hypothetical protein